MHHRHGISIWPLLFDLRSHHLALPLFGFAQVRSYCSPMTTICSTIILLQPERHEFDLPVAQLIDRTILLI